MVKKVIPQVDFDKAVQKVLAVGLSRTAAENIVIVFWNICVDQDLNFKQFIDKATATGKLDVDQNILDYVNTTLPDTIKYYKDRPATLSPIVAREL
jgi:hypothetical protein